MILPRACRCCAFQQVSYSHAWRVLHMMYRGVGSGLEKEGGISPQEDRNFLGVIFLYIYVLFECKPIVEAAWGFK